ncbi:delta-aminolevulinic acid dehydratase [Bernardetia litoralis DSM 6794]|uniref:Delta-aminolevulinic acid dehydratase n=1 Tax=Bernardetia litoralis (strain ATCC 23117 / DSM 6794 / NBRC 15988 / NCIMB 1366 / Fx l1 / Sio-4) TaxID=880071 RepID=I4AN39_BERLS|nr:porphobilinogen synthase [Bernardetia litoralis]AFM05374.1 delta-aminolevulinic acid dehydratase [Bernardetia litoralis DSM 6794]
MSFDFQSMRSRPRRNRQSAVIRAMVEETSLSISDFMFPVFVMEGTNKKEPIASMPNIFRYSLDRLLEEIEECYKLGIRAFAPFPSLTDEYKDAMATSSHNPENIYLKAITAIKEKFPDVFIMTDIAMDPYSSDGHDGIYKDGKILNDETLEVLGKMAVAQARAGADYVGPSDMMDGRVAYLRHALDKEGFQDVGIIAYTAKYASAFYGPFRDALDSEPRFGDKKTYQMNPANVREALLEAKLDIEEGADMIMVKPALSYLDVISKLNQNSNIPIVAYNVSGEYAIVKAGAEKGWIDGEKIMLETLLSIKRAGAKIILSYFAKEVAQILSKK